MGLRGPRPMPSALKRLSGGRQSADLEPAAAVVAEPGRQPAPGEISARRFRPPRPLPEEGMREWRRLVRVLSRMRVLTEADADALWAICRDWAALAEVEEQMRQGSTRRGAASSGLVWVSKSSGLPRISPLFLVQRRLLDSIMRGLREFGLTPAARRNVQAASATRRHSDAGLLDGQWYESETAELGAGRVPDTEGLSLQ